MFASGWVATLRGEDLEYTHAFILDLAMFDGLRITTEAKSVRVCKLAREMTNKKLLQEVEGIIKYNLGECAPQR
jgi:hypothetical protein